MKWALNRAKEVGSSLRAVRMFGGFVTVSTRIYLQDTKMVAPASSRADRLTSDPSSTGGWVHEQLLYDRPPWRDPTGEMLTMFTLGGAS